MIQLVLLRASQLPLLLDVEKVLFTPMLTLGALLLLFTSIAAAMRGSRPAWYFLAGWVPLVFLTAASHMQLRGGLAGGVWRTDASLAVGAFEAIMLSIGLSDRALTLRQDRDEVRVLADHDALTDVYNRLAWSERASALLAATPARPLALLFLDLDHFKALNDRLGHHSGDRALIAVAKALATELRPQDLLGRYGGEEFVVLLDATSAAQALDVATRLCRRVHRLEIPANGENSMLTVSIGIAMHREGDTLESLIERADQAMYSAKLNGRNQVCVHQLATSRERSMHLLDRRSRDS
jgi:diguanylate cyclase (GGDEF)-like protein